MKHSDIVYSKGGSPLCGRSTRRDALRFAAALGLSFSVPAMSSRAAEKRRGERPKSLITLWMQGGPSQLETWDPHPGTKIGGPTKAIDTALPGVQIAADFPLLAECIDELNVVRSLVSKEGDHERGTYYVKTGYRPDTTLVHPSLGSIVARELPGEGIEIPTHVSLLNAQWPARGGYLGDGLDAFKVYQPGRTVPNIRSGVSDERHKQRLRNLEVLSNSFRVGRKVPAERTLHEDTIQRALSMMSSEQLKAFEIEDESQSVRDAYGNTNFGRGCLVARRLVETGVRAIEVTLSGFDTHINNFESHSTLATTLDPAFSTLIQDLRDRELLDSTVVLCIGEFGRGPEINPADGRDHWPSGFSCLVGGGGLASGVLIGGTDPTGVKKTPSDPISVGELYATILHTLGVDPEMEVITPIGRPMRYCEGSPVVRLLG